MKLKSIASAIMFTLAGTATSANAAEILFEGLITTVTCTAEDGKDILFPLPPFAAGQVQKINEHISASTLAVNIQCENATQDGTVTMSFQPHIGTTDGELLMNTAQGGAQGVGIVMIDENNKVLNFEQGAVGVTAPLKSGAAVLKLNATYALEKGVTNENVVPGIVTAALPFVLSYE